MRGLDDGDLNRSWCSGFERGRGRDGADEAIAATRQGLDEMRIIGGVAKRLAQTVDGGIYAMVEIKVSIFGPESQAQLIASDEFAVALEEYAENLKRLTGE